MKPLNIHKICDALITDRHFAKLSGKEPLPESHSHKGMWIAGTISINNEQLRFIPKGIEKAPHLDQTGICIPFSEIKKIDWKFGLISSLVILQYSDEEFCFSCFRGGKLAKTISTYLKP